MNKMELKPGKEEIHVLSSTVITGTESPEEVFDFDTPLDLVTNPISVQSAYSSSQISQKMATGSPTTNNIDDSSVEFTESNKVKRESNQNKDQLLSEGQCKGDNIIEIKQVNNSGLENLDESEKIESRNVNERNSLLGDNLKIKQEEKLENSVENCVDEIGSKICSSTSTLDQSKVGQCVVKITKDKFLPNAPSTLTIIKKSEAKEHSNVGRVFVKDGHRKFKGCRSLKVVCTKIKEVVPEVSQRSRTSPVNRFCELCGVKFSTKRKWEYHQRYKHNSAIKHYECTICTYSTPYFSTFKRHKEMHEYRKLRKQAVQDEIITSHMCDKCGKCFVSRGNLLTHVRAHINPPSFHCALCDKSFTQKGNLKTHLQHHQKQEEKKGKLDEFSNVDESRKIIPSSCKFCNKVFRWKGDLSRHIKTIHHGIKNFSCNVCCKKFADKTALKKHQFNHEGTRPFHCSLCDKCYTNKFNLERHVSNRHTPKE